MRIGEHQVPAMLIGASLSGTIFNSGLVSGRSLPVEDDSRIVQFEGAVEQQVFRLRGTDGSRNGKEGKAMSQCHGSDLRRRWKII